MTGRNRPRLGASHYPKRINKTHSPVLVYGTPILTILLGSLLPTFFVASAIPFMPPFGFLTLIAWRIIRPGMLPVWAGFPLGLFDDLVSGQPFGSAIMLWSMAMIAMDVLDMRLPWRSFVQDWMVTLLALAIYLISGLILSGAPITLPGLAALLPQFILSAMLFPLIARIVARLDRLRLMRIISV